MNVLFVHGHKFRRIHEHIYTPGGFQDDILGRYAKWFGSLTVIGRIIDEKEASKKYKEITHQSVKIVDNSDMEKLVKECDALIIRLPSINGYNAVYLAKKYKKPYLIEVVACIWDAYWNYGVKGKIVALPAMKIMQKCVKNAKYVVYVSQKFLQSRYPTDGQSVAISDVELMRTDDNILENRLKRIKQKNTKKIILGTTAAIDVPHKGQEYVIKAIQKLEKQLGVEIEYQLVGGGESQRLSEISKACGVEGKVKFMGFMNHDEVFTWLDNIDIYIQSSFQEGLCRALVEAMSRGLPCVASAVGGNPELIDERYIFSMKRKKEISNQICEAVGLLFTEQHMTEEAMKNFQHAKSTFAKELLAQKRDDFYLSFKNEVEQNAED